MRAKKSKKIATKVSWYEWIIYAQSYLKMAEIGVRELEDQNYVKRGMDRYFFYENKLLLIPIIWNFKHAIELVIKTLGIAVDKQYLKNHDFVELRDDLKQSLQKLKIKKIEKIEDLVEIIDKYYRCEFWDKKIIKTGTILDVENDIFRYPENRAFFFFDPQMLKDISSRETEDLSDDIKKLKSLLFILIGQIGHSKFIKKIAN